MLVPKVVEFLIPSKPLIEFGEELERPGFLATLQPLSPHTGLWRVRCWGSLSPRLPVSAQLATPRSLPTGQSSPGQPSRVHVMLCFCRVFMCCECLSELHPARKCLRFTSSAQLCRGLSELGLSQAWPGLLHLPAPSPSVRPARLGGTLLWRL